MLARSFRVWKNTERVPNAQWIRNEQNVSNVRSNLVWHHRPDEASACVEGTVATKEKFCFVLVACIYLPYIAS